jgi:hypothetical protein
MQGFNLICRNLMMSENLENLGFGEQQTYVRLESQEGQKEKEGFLSGTGIKAGKSNVFWKK